MIEWPFGLGNNDKKQAWLDAMSWRELDIPIREIICNFSIGHPDPQCCELNLSVMDDV